MGWKFQKRIRLLPGITLNLSRKGVSTSIGTRGARVTLGHGKRRTTVGIPGSGISHTDVVSTKTARRSTRGANSGPQGRGGRWLKLLLIAVAIFIVALFIGLKDARAINKCTGPDGKVAYQEAACAGSGTATTIKSTPSTQNMNDLDTRIKRAAEKCGVTKLPEYPEIGWTEEQFLSCSVVALSGTPAINITETAAGQSKQYVFRYYRTYVYVRGAKVVAIQR